MVLVKIQYCGKYRTMSTSVSEKGDGEIQFIHRSVEFLNLIGQEVFFVILYYNNSDSSAGPRQRSVLNNHFYRNR